MKKLLTVKFIAVLALFAALTGCGGKGDLGRVYMPDMGPSRAFETYALLDSTKFTSTPERRGGSMIYYDYIPAPGTIKRGELFPYTLPNDSNGYRMSAAVKNPMDTIRFSMAETKRLYNINCGICHGEKGAGNGPLGTSGKIGGIANLTLPQFVAMADGTMFHSITYGRNLMGSYASQLSRQERWQLVKYIRTLQGPATADTTKPAAGTDSTATAKK